MVDRNENNRYISRACDFVTECDKQKKKKKKMKRKALNMFVSRSNSVSE